VVVVGGGGLGEDGRVGALKGILGGNVSLRPSKSCRSHCTCGLRATKVHTLFKASGREERYPSQDTNYYLLSTLKVNIPQKGVSYG